MSLRPPHSHWNSSNEKRARFIVLSRFACAEIAYNSRRRSKGQPGEPECTTSGVWARRSVEVRQKSMYSACWIYSNRTAEYVSKAFRDGARLWHTFGHVGWCKNAFCGTARAVQQPNSLRLTRYSDDVGNDDNGTAYNCRTAVRMQFAHAAVIAACCMSLHQFCL